MAFLLGVILQMRSLSFLFLYFAVLMTACSEEIEPEQDAEAPAIQQEEQLLLQKTSFEAVPFWATDQGKDKALSAFIKSCGKFKWRQAEQNFSFLGKNADWQEVCRMVPETYTADQADQFFTDHFVPYLVQSSETGAEGLFTGYYEPEIQAHFVKEGAYQYPLYQRPEDLVMVEIGDFIPSLKGQRLAGRVKEGRLYPYEDRAKIESGALTDQNLELLYSTSKIDNFMLQIQGSGAVRLPDQSLIRIGYAAQNGHAYTAIGKPLIEMGAIAREDMSMQAIRQWLLDHPDQADQIMNLNRSYVFFRLLETAGPVGAQNVVLTPERSLAIDRKHLPYGVPLFLSAEHPDLEQEYLSQLMIAQDTGGAIRGIVRGDVFWGAGAQAELYAGQMASKGKYWLLVPKNIEISERFLNNKKD